MMARLLLVSFNKKANNEIKLKQEIHFSHLALIVPVCEAVSRGSEKSSLNSLLGLTYSLWHGPCIINLRS